MDSTTEIHFLGTGTSLGIPMIGCQCAVCQSQDNRDKRLRSSVLIRHHNQSLAIDCGPDFRQQMLSTRCDDLYHLLFTHEHRDHVAGLDDIRSFNYLYKRPIHAYMSPQVHTALKHEFRYVFQPGDYKGGPKINVHTIKAYHTFELIDLPITPLAAMHGNMPVLGYRIGDIAYLTDVNYIPQDSIKQLKGIKILILNALQQEKHHSHYSLSEAIAVARDINAPITYFTHIGHFMGKHEDTEKCLPPSMHLAYDGLVLTV